jgi:hypothetical protein
VFFQKVFRGSCGPLLRDYLLYQIISKAAGTENSRKNWWKCGAELLDGREGGGVKLFYNERPSSYKLKIEGL